MFLGLGENDFYYNIPTGNYIPLEDTISGSQNINLTSNFSYSNQTSNDLIIE